VSIAQPAATIDAVLEEGTLCSAFLRVAETQPNRPALSDFGAEVSLSYDQWRERAAAVAGGLSTLGVARGDRVAMLLSNRWEFHVADIGALLLGAVPFSLYVTSPPAQLAPCIANAERAVLITERTLLEPALELRSQCPSLEHVVTVDDPADATPVISLEQLTALCPPDFDVEATAARVGPEDLCSLVYTSGTTGPPKGVPYLHRCLMTTMKSIHGHVPVSPDGRVISYLPMAHIAERMFGHYAGFVFGYDITSLRDTNRLGDALRAVRPTRFFGVPRIWEKLLAGVQRRLG
jgi:long-subunit acyl-CoA synthetase (AMP-forming)